VTQQGTNVLAIIM